MLGRCGLHLYLSLSISAPRKVFLVFCGSGMGLAAIIFAAIFWVSSNPESLIFGSSLLSHILSNNILVVLILVLFLGSFQFGFAPMRYTLLSELFTPREQVLLERLSMLADHLLLSDHYPRKQWEAWTTVRFGSSGLSQQRCFTCCTPTMGSPPSSLASSASASPASSSPFSLFLRQERGAGEKLTNVFKGQQMRPMCQLVFEMVPCKNIHAAYMMFLAASATFNLGEQVTT